MTLGPKTVLVGANGAGKSTVLQSIELALRGAASDVEGRDAVKQPRAVGRLFPDGVEPDIECTLSNGMTFTWKMARDKDGACKEPEARRPIDVAWPFQDLQELLAGNAATVAAWLEKRISGGMSLEELLASLPPEVREEVTALQRKMRTTDFMTLSKAAKDEARLLRKDATKQEKLIEQMMTGLRPPLSTDERKLLQHRVDAADRVEGMTEAEYEALKRDVKKWADQFVEAEQAVSNLPEVPPQVLQAAEKVRSTKKLCAEHERLMGTEMCWVCGKGSAADLANQKVWVEKASAAVQAQLAVMDENERLRTQLTVIQTRLEASVERFKTAKVSTTNRDEVNGYRDRLAADGVVRQTWLNAEATRREVSQARVRADYLTTAAKVLADAGQRWMEAKKGQFEDAVSSFLPLGDHFLLDLEAGRVGLFRDGQLHSALSGAEWTRTLMALASASHDPNKPAILAPPDRAWDRSTLSKVMVALKDAPCQVILMSTVEPMDVEGWTVVRVGA
jgi:ABC-type branched-subunit amino acid transport system ATPase component